MDILETVIFNLTSDEVRRFKILSNRFKADEEKKLIILFDAIRSGKYINHEDQLVKNLYREVNAKTRNRYYRLRNKLLDNIEKSLVFYHFKYKAGIHAYYDIQLSILFRERGNYDLSLYFLKKAEKTATENDQFNILEVVYEEYVQLAMKDITLNLDRVLEQRRLNEEKLKQHRKNSESLAVIIQQLKRVNFGKGNKNISGFLERTRKRLERTNEIFHSTEGRIQIFRTVSAMMQQKRTWQQLADFTRATLEEFLTNGWFTNDNHSSRLMMRLWLVNALIKSRKFREASAQISVFENEMEMFGRQNHSTYYFNYINARVNLLKYSGANAEAGTLLRKALEGDELRGLPQYEPYLRLSQADYYFNQGEFEKAQSALEGLARGGKESVLAPEIRVFVDVFQLATLINARQYKAAQKLHSTLRKSHKALLKESGFAAAADFAEILGRMARAGESGKRVSLNAAWKNFVTDHGHTEPGDNSIILYDVWLQSQAEEKNYYSLLLQRMGEN